MTESKESKNCNCMGWVIFIVLGALLWLVASAIYDIGFLNGEIKELDRELAVMEIESNDLIPQSWQQEEQRDGE